MLEAVFVANNEPSMIVSKFQVPPKTSELAEFALKCIRDASNPSEFKPIVYNQPHTYFFRHSGEVWLACVVDGDAQTMMFVSILDKIEELLNLYVEKPLTDYGVKNNFALIYRIIDMFLDSSYPLADDYNGLMQFIAPKGLERVTLNTIAPWRASGPVYKKQNVLLDVTEFVDYIVGLSGKVDILQIRGEIQMQAEVNGSPRCSFVWKNSPLFDDIAFHRSVDYGAFMSSKRIELVPPQGKFLLANYRMQMQAKLPLDIKAIVTPTRGKLDIKITINADKQIDDLSIKFDIPGAKESTLQAKQGELILGFETCTWKVGRIKAGKSTELTGAVGCSDECRQTVFCVNFQTEGLLSNCELTGVSIEGTADQNLYVGAKYLTRAGRFQIRAGQQ